MQNETEQEWGEANLREILRKVKDDPAQTVITQVIIEIDRFAEGALQYDDITLLVLKPNGFV